MPEKSGFTPLFCEKDFFSDETQIRIINMADSAYVADKIMRMKLEKVAKMIHEKFCEKEKINNNWDIVSEENKELNFSAAEQIPFKLSLIEKDIKEIIKQKSLFLTNKEIELLARMGHEQWYSEKMLSGWKYGKIKDDLKKENPYLIEWNKLSDKAKEIQSHFIEIIPQIIQMDNKDIPDEWLPDKKDVIINKMTTR